MGTRATNERQGAVVGQAAAPPPYLMAEVAGTRENHRNIVLVAGLDALVVALGATGLDDAGHAVCGKHVDVVAEREERVTRAGKAALLHAFALAKVLGAFAGKQCGVNAVGLTRPMPMPALPLETRMALDLTPLQTFQANSSSAISASVGLRSVGNVKVAGSSVTWSTSCTSMPPSMERSSTWHRGPRRR